MLTRRELLAGAGSTAAALALAGCGGARPLGPSRLSATPAVPRAVPMRKGISLIGDVNLYDDALGVRPYLLDGPRPATFVGFWAIWPALQPQAPDPFTRVQAFRDLDDPHGPAAGAFAALDAQIARANADGRTVALTLYQSFPAWTRPSVPLEPSRDPASGGAGYPELGQDGLPHDAHLPDDLGPDGPWAWLVGYLCRRYGGENPSGSRIDWLQPLN